MLSFYRTSIRLVGWTCTIGPSRYSFPWVCVRTARSLLRYAVSTCRYSCGLVPGSQLVVSHNTVWCTWCNHDRHYPNFESSGHIVASFIVFTRPWYTPTCWIFKSGQSRGSRQASGWLHTPGFFAFRNLSHQDGIKLSIADHTSVFMDENLVRNLLLSDRCNWLLQLVVSNCYAAERSLL